MRDAPPTERVATFLAGAAILAYFAISSQLLTALGIPYDYPGGNPISKFHPGTYLTILAFCALAAGPRSPFLSQKQFLRFADLAAFVFITLSIAIGSLLRFGLSGTAFYVDSLIAPALLTVVLLSMPDHIKIRIFYLIIWFLLMNAAIGAIEVLLSERLIPFTIGGQIETKRYFRATALLGHPLSNASATALALPSAVFLSPNRFVRVVTVFVFILGLLAFGGRMAFALSLSALMFLAIVVTARNLLTGRFTDRQGILFILGMFIIPMFIVALMFLTNLGERFFGQFYWDESAQTRLDSIALISYMSWNRLLYGVPVADMDFLKESIHAGRTIENSWILLILRMGLIAFVPFICTFFLVMLGLWRAVTVEGKIAMLMFLFFVSSGPTLAVKGIGFAIFITILLCSAAVARARAL